MMIIIYTVMLAALLPLIIPWYLHQVLRHKKYRRGFLERAGCVPDPGDRRNGPVVWVHAASVGEVLAAEPLVNEIKRRMPATRLFLTTNTDTGHDMASKKIGVIEKVFQTPFDLPWIVGRFISRIQPSILVIMETEIWPNMITACRKRNIPVVMANGRISDRAFPRYGKLRWFFKPVLSSMTACIMQSARDAERIIAIGAPEQAVAVAGNVKYDRNMPEPADPVIRRCLETLAWTDPSRILIAGSTHDAEEPIVCEAFQTVLKQFPDYRMILAPRHVNRTGEVCGTLKKHGLRYVLRTECAPDVSGPAEQEREIQVLVLNVMGELFQAYSAGSIAFVGGSLQQIGGHNVLEPAALAKPVLFGPYTANFTDAVTQLLIHNGGRCVRSSRDLADTIIEYTTNPELRLQTGRNALTAVESNRGAVARHVDRIQQVMSGETEPLTDKPVETNARG
jgi:3-deoxy-D-manno-octulosonic-acid transferase